MIKLNYNEMHINDLIVYVAKYRKNKNIRLSINRDNLVKVTCPYFISDFDVKKFILEKEQWIKKVIEANDKKQNKLQYRKLTKIEKKELMNKVISIVNKYEKLMNTKVAHITLRDMKTLWGSCTFKTHWIRLSTRLYFTTEEYLEYVVLHEMAHIFVPNHSRVFYDIIRKYMPNYKEIIKKANVK